MEYCKYGKKSLQIINVVLVLIVISFFYIYKSIYDKYYFWEISLFKIITIVVILALLLFSFFDKFDKIYPKLLYVMLCMVTFGIMGMSFLIDNTQYLFVFIFLLTLIIISVFNKKGIKKFLFIFSLFAGQYIFILDVGMEKKVIIIMSLVAITSLAYIEKRYIISEQKNNEEIKEFNQQVLLNAKEAFALHEIIFDQDNKPINYRYIYVNKAYEEITGLIEKEIIGKRVFEVLPKTEWYWIEFFGSVVTEKERKQITNYSRELGKYFEVRAYPVDDVKFAVLFTDVTEYLEKENKLKYALQRAVQVEELKNQFLKDINHRLRNPFNGMMGMLQMISVEELDKENQELFNAMLISVRQFNNILDQISKYTEIQGMHYEYTKQNILELISIEISKYEMEQIHINLFGQENCKNIEISIEKNVFIMTFAEILSNAVKHTKNQIVDVELYVELNSSKDSQVLHIDIIDYGNGIEKDKQEYIFNEFYHHDFVNVYRQPEKISLAICRQMLQKMGGNISVESEVGVKTKFMLNFPVSITPTKF